MLGRAGNHLDKGFGAKKYADVIPLLEVKITRYDSSKQKQRVIKTYYQRLILLRKEKLHKKRRHTFLR
jgi:hypothetical protein